MVAKYVDFCYNSELVGISKKEIGEFK